MITPFYQDNHITQFCMDFRENDLPNKSVQCVVTSPPYWGLRKYSGEQDLIWGDNNCEHEWVDNTYVRNNDQTAGAKQKTNIGAIGRDEPIPNGFCSLCGAWKGAYGLEPTPEMYAQHTIEILREIRRVLREDGVVFWNIGDSYASGKGTCFNPGGGKGSFSGHGDRKDAGAYPLDRGNVSMLKASGLKPKDLCLIPQRLMIAAQEDGWWIRSIIIWSKPNPMPESVTDRPTESHEYLLMLTQSGKSLYWIHRDGGGTREKPKADYRWVNQLTQEEVTIEPADWKTKIKCPECKATGMVNVYLGLDVWQEEKCPTCNGKKKTQLWKRINLWRGHDYYWDADAVREQWKPESVARDQRGYNSSMYARTRQANINDNRTKGIDGGQADYSGRNIRTVWEFPTQPYPEAHFAVFPEKLPELCIKASTPEVGCCSKCGAPWERVIESKQYPRHGTEPHDLATDGDGANKGKHAQPTETKTIGWQPTCKCNADKVPSLVLDPFMGAGTTLWVAKKLNRHAVGYEISEEYCQLATDRCRQQVLV